MPKNIKSFVLANFFALKRVCASQENMPNESSALQESFAASGLEGKSWQDLVPEMQTLVGAPIEAWHAGHLAQMKGQALPQWDKRDTYINGYSKTQQLEELQRQAADTLAEMKYALVREALTRHAQLYDTDVQTKMKSLLSEIYDKSRKDPMLLLGHLANRQYALHIYSNSPKPSAQWSKTDKTTELVCQLANLTYLQIQTSLQASNNIEQNNVPTDTVADISVR